MSLWYSINLHKLIKFRVVLFCAHDIDPNKVFTSLCCASTEINFSNLSKLECNSEYEKLLKSIHKFLVHEEISRLGRSKEEDQKIVLTMYAITVNVLCGLNFFFLRSA